MPKNKISLHGSESKRVKERLESKRFSTVARGWGKGFVNKPHFDKRMLLPHFWGAWCIIFLWFLLVNLLPAQVLLFIGRKIGRCLGAIIPARKYVLRRNLELAFPEKTPEERRKLSIKIQENSGMAIFETGFAWFWPDWRLKRHIVFDSQDIAKAKELAASGSPILVLTCHFVTLELMARIYATLITPGIGVYRPSDHPVWEWMQVKGRLRKNLALVDRKDPRSMIKALMRHYPIWYAPDQDYGAAVSVFVPFFGVSQTATVTGTHNLAKIKGTKVQPSWTIRENGKYHLYVKEPLKDFPGTDEILDAKRINGELERIILMAPEQYLWLHRRFKTVPKGSESRYPKLTE